MGEDKKKKCHCNDHCTCGDDCHCNENHNHKTHKTADFILHFPVASGIAPRKDRQKQGQAQKNHRIQSGCQRRYNKKHCQCGTQYCDDKQFVLYF